MPSSAEPQERWFLPDKPVKDDAHDEFSHADVARNLAEMVRGESAPPIIGLLGPFGVGKSSVVELLGEQLKGSKTLAVIRVSAERHSEPTGLHRTLLYAVGEALANNKLREPQDVARILKAVEQSSELATSRLTDIPLLKILRTNTRAVLRALGIFIAVVALWIGAVMAAAAIWNHGHYLDTLTSGLAVPLALIIALVVALVRVIAATDVLSPVHAALVTPDKVTELTPRAEVADEFERVFADLVKIDGKRLVVAIDDVDRLAPERVLETLHVIHSFQRACQNPQPIFIVSCDERIVRDAIAEARPGLAGRANDLQTAATAYLDRMFLQRQYIPPHPARDMRGYAKDLLAAPPHTGAVHLGERLGDVVEVLIHDGVVDPRHAIRLLNAFFGDYRLALLRETGEGRRKLRAGEVTSYPLLLARLTVLKVDFPDAYVDIVGDTDVLEALDRWAREQQPSERDRDLLKRYFAEPRNADVPPKPPVPEEMARPTDETANLLRYLSRTRDWVAEVDSLLPFLYLGQDEIDRRLGSGEARRVKEMLANAQVDPLRDHVKAIASRTDADAQEDIDALVDLFGELLSSLTGLELANAQNTLCRVFGELPVRLRGSLANRIGRFAQEETQTLQLAVGDAITIAAAATDVGSRETLFKRVLLGSDDVSALNASAKVVYQRGGELASAAYPQADVDGFVVGAISAAATTASLPLLHSWLELVPPPDSAAQMPAPVPSLLAASYLEAIAAQPADAPNLDDADVDTLARVFQSDEESREKYADQAVKIINAHGLGESFGRAALMAADAAGELTKQRAANLVHAISTKALAESGGVEPNIEPGSIRRMVSLLVRWCPSVTTFTTPSGDEKVPILTLVTPVCAAMIGEATQLAAIVPKTSTDVQLQVGEVRTLTQELFSVLATNQPTAVGPCVVALTAQWQQRRGAEADAYLWIEPVLSVVDTLEPAISDPVLAGILDGMVGMTRADAVATSSLPVLDKALTTQTGVRAVPALIATLSSQLTPANPDGALFAMDVIGHVYDSAPESAASDAANVVSALNALIAPRTPPLLAEGLRCLTRTQWPSQDLSTVVNTASQYWLDLADVDLDDILVAVSRASAASVSLSELSNELANRLIDRVVARAEDEPTTARALWRLSGPLARARIAVSVAGVTEEERATLESNPGERPAEIERWMREIISSVDTGSSTFGTRESMAVAQLYPEESGAIVSVIANECLSATAAVPLASWPLLLLALVPSGMTQLGQLLYASLGEGKDQALRALPVLTAWAGATSPDVLGSVIDVDNLGAFIRTWVLDQHDVDVSRAVRPLLSVLIPPFQRTIRDRVGRRPRGDARPAWDAAFGDE